MSILSNVYLFFHCALFSFKNPWSLLVSHPESATLIPADFVVIGWDELESGLFIQTISSAF
jgi:hypothetical protein